MARGRRSSRGGKTIQSVRWLALAGEAAALTAGSVGSTILSSTQLGTQGQTLLRIRGNLVAYRDGTATPGGAARVGVGLHLVPDGTGTTVTITPLADAASDWLFHSAFIVGYEEMVTDVIDIPGISAFREVIDSKAMRRRRGNEELQLVVSNESVLAAIGINVFLDGRILWGL